MQIKDLPLDILWVGISDSQVRTQPGQAQGIEGAGSILVVPQIVLRIAGEMVNLDVIAHLQQFVHVKGWLTGIHGKLNNQAHLAIKMGSK